MSEFIEQENYNEKRPTQLLVIAILSFVYMGWGILSNLSALASGPMDQEDLTQMKAEVLKNTEQFKEMDAEWAINFMKQMVHYYETINKNHNMNILTTFLIIFIGVAGVVMMLRRMKLGFHIYIIYSFLASVQMYLFVSPNSFSNTMVILSLIFSGIFILLYSRNLNWLK